MIGLVPAAAAATGLVTPTCFLASLLGLSSLVIDPCQTAQIARPARSRDCTKQRHLKPNFELPLHCTASPASVHQKSSIGVAMQNLSEKERKYRLHPYWVGIDLFHVDILRP